MKNMETYERKNRLGEALSIRNMKQIELAEKTNISKGTISNWVQQKYQPKHDSLFILSQALEVSELWLAGYDVAMERPEAQVNMDVMAQFIKKLRKNERLKKLCYNIADLEDNQFTVIETMVNELIRVK